MADFTTANLIVSVVPERYQNSVPTDTTIVVTFLRDMDRTTFSDATIAVQILGTVLRVPCTYSYTNRILTITPTSALQPNTPYQVTLVGDTNPAADAFTTNITGIRDITGNGMVGVFQWEFLTTSVVAPQTPVLLTPTPQSAIGNQPIFQWTAVAASGSLTTTYEIEVSTTNTFETIYWPLDTDIVNPTSTMIVPARSFAYNQEYWWRVRALFSDGTNTLPGNWSTLSNFYYGDPTYGTVTPDDKPLGLIPPTPALTAVQSATPAPGTSNLITYPSIISVALTGPVDLSQLSTASFWIEGAAVDGTWDPDAFKPIFSPSLNGSIYGSGGITAPGPEDSYQQILVSGKLTATPQGQAGTSATTISLAVPPSYFQDNNRYTIHLELAELVSPLEWSFTSRWAPVFASVWDVRESTDFFLPELTDDDIWYRIRRNSLYAIMIQVFVPTQVDAQSWIYHPPMSFNPNNPPFFAREYVRLKSTLDFLRDKYHQLLTSASKQLGDFKVDGQNAALKENLALAIQELKDQIRPFEDKLHGHTNRGYARGAYSGRGDNAIDSNPLRRWPFGLVRKGPNFDL